MTEIELLDKLLTMVNQAGPGAYSLAMVYLGHSYFQSVAVMCVVFGILYTVAKVIRRLSVNEIFVNRIRLALGGRYHLSFEDQELVINIINEFQMARRS